jgi:hypothetical protein
LLHLHFFVARLHYTHLISQLTRIPIISRILWASIVVIAFFIPASNVILLEGMATASLDNHMKGELSAIEQCEYLFTLILKFSPGRYPRGSDLEQMSGTQAHDRSSEPGRRRFHVELDESQTLPV